MSFWRMPLFLLTVSALSPSLCTGACPGSCTPLARTKRDGTACTNSPPGQTMDRGCSVCVCKFHRWECIYNGCKGCRVPHNESSTEVYSHGDSFSSGCLTCTCDDGALQCNHAQCLGCQSRGNITQSGLTKDLGCGNCTCFDGIWSSCDGACDTSSATHLAPALFLLLAVLI